MTNFLRQLVGCFYCGLFFVLIATQTAGQWTNRYPKIANVSHHVYLEGYNLPTLNQTASDPTVSPDNRTLALAARGWLWLMDLETREARRVTRGGGIDSRPAWSPDGKQIAFVRDDTKDTNIFLLDLTNESERILVKSPGIDLDPAFSHDGRTIFYSSSEGGDLDLWRVDVATGEKKRLTSERGQELQPQPLVDDAQLLYVSKTGNVDAISILDLRDNTKRVLREEGISAQMRLALKSDGQSFAANLPAQSRYQMFLNDIKSSLLIQTAFNSRYPLSPTWSSAESQIYYVEPDETEQFHVFRMPATGGAPVDVSPRSWNWGEPTNRVTIKTRRAGETSANLPVRLSIVDQNNHPVVPDKGQPRFDGQNGNVFFY